ncbi:MAG: hypothetical protein ACJ768_06220 [Gaiellaceae bacterium]
MESGGLLGVISFSPPWRLGVGIALGVFSLLGLWALTDVIGWKVLLILAGAVVLVLLAFVSEFIDALALVVLAIAVPWLCLLGFNLVWHAITGDDARPALVPGLVGAGVVFAIAATGCLLLWRERTVVAPFVALLLAGANVIGVPLLAASFRHQAAVAAPQRIVSQLDTAIVVPTGAPGGSTSPIAPARQSDLDVRYSVARAGSARVEWLLLDSADPLAANTAAAGGTRLEGAPAWRESADQQILLDVDGTPPTVADPAKLPSVKSSPGEVSRWLQIARGIHPQASVAVLLQTTDQKRIDAWTRAVGRNGSVASVQELGARTLTDAAVALAADAPDASEVLSLALRFRPVLLFDDRERLRAPLDIDAFLRSGRVQLCRDNRLKGSECKLVARASDLVNGATHLQIAKRDLRKPEPPSAIYVHPTETTQDGRRLLLLDYWWYLDGNPAPEGHGISCGPGLALPGITCFDHDSDWEGMAVVLDRTGPEAAPVAIQYAQHDSVVRYDFARLRAYWADRARRDRLWRSARFRRNLDAIDDLDRRPLDFVARGTHAAYALPCASGCRQVAAGRPEKPHTGLYSWPANDTAKCVATACVRLLPTRNGGRDAALWNAYQGVWGSRECILNGAYCTAEAAPAAPGTQGRYEHPTHITGYVDERWRFHACDGGGCTKLPLPGA